MSKKLSEEQQAALVNGIVSDVVALHTKSKTNDAGDHFLSAEVETDEGIAMMMNFVYLSREMAIQAVVMAEQLGTIDKDRLIMAIIGNIHEIKEHNFKEVVEKKRNERT